MPGNAEDCRFRRATLEQFCNALVPKVVKPKSLQASGSRVPAPGCTPRLLQASGVDVRMLAGWENVVFWAGDTERTGQVKKKAEP